MRYRDLVSVNRRYSRSINLERDFLDSELTKSYALTPRGLEVLHLFKNRFVEQTEVRSFTISAVYGSGKSAFFQFFLSLLAKEGNIAREKALSFKEK